MNRYYRPSAPRYTSQFIEEPYPADLLIQSGAMKQQQLQQIREGIGQFESIIDEYTQPGYRTVKIAPEVRNDWHNKLQETISQFATNYDSPQAIQAFSRLRSQWLRDPDVNLIKMDREIGNPQWDDILKSSTYDLDIKPDIDPKTGTLWQFERDSQFQPYKGSYKFADLSKYAEDAYGNIPTEKKFMWNQGPYIDALGRVAMGTVQGDFEYRDPERIRTETNKLMQDIKYGRTQEGLYTRERLRYYLGREPSDEEIYAELYPAEQKAMLKKESLRRSDDIIDMNKLQNGPGTGEEPFILPLGTAEQAYGESVSKKKVRRMLRDYSNNSNISVKDSDIISQLRKHNAYRNGIDYSNLTEAEKKKADINFIREKQSEPYRLKVEALAFDDKFKERLTSVLTSDTYQNGVIKVPKGTELANEFMSGLRIWDYESHEEILKDKDKREIIRPDQQFNIAGRVTAKDATGTNNIGLQPAPGMFAVEAGGKTYLMQIPSLVSEEEKIIWNLEGDIRDYVTGMGSTFILYHRNNGDISSYDISDTSNKEESQVNLGTIKGEEGPLYYKPVTDWETGDKLIKVYAKNPLEDTKRKGESTETSNIINNTNKYFIREYRLSDFGYNAQELMNQLIEDSKENMNAAKTKY